MKIFILTSAYNEYNQHGDYFLKAFATKPSAEEIKKVIVESKEFVDDSIIQDLLDTGCGKSHGGDVWWSLEEANV